MRARALADRAGLAVSVGAADSLDQAQQALAIAREVDDPALLARALTACGVVTGSQRRSWPRPYFAEAIGLARAAGRSVAAQPAPRLPGARRLSPPVTR